MTALIVISARYLIALPVAIAIAYALIARRKREYLVYALSVLALTFALGLAARQLYYDPLPFVVQGVQPLIPHEANNGFPSDHALLSGALAASLVPFSLPVGILMWLLAIVIGTARVFALVHHPIDIVAAFVIAAFAGVIAVYAARLFKRPER